LADPPDNADEDATEKQVADLIVEYLREHPHAMDTAEGVAAWWLPESRRPANLLVTRRALERLVAGGLLEKIGQGDRAHYGLRKHRGTN
jgi:hypothetical protein